MHVRSWLRGSDAEEQHHIYVVSFFWGVLIYQMHIYRFASAKISVQFATKYHFVILEMRKLPNEKKVYMMV